MASETDDPPGAAANASPRRRRRPTPTIDLQATEVARGPQESAAKPAEDSVQISAAADAPQGEDTAASSPSEPQPNTPDAESSATKAAAEKPASEPPATSSERKWPGWLPDYFAWPLVAAGAAGGGIVLLVFAVLWLAGVFSPRDDGSNALNARLTLIELRLREIPNVPTPANIDAKTLADISSRLDKLEAAAAAPPPPASDAGLANRLAAVEAAVKTFQGRVADLDRRADDSAAAVREARGRADAAMLAVDAGPAAERGNVEALTKRIAALEQATKTLADDLVRRMAAGGDRPVRLAVAAQALRAAVERGDPFAAELAAVKPLATDPQALTPLEPFAASGVPTVAALARQLTELAPAMRRLAAAPPPQGGFLDRLQANAERLVRIRPIDDAPGDDPAAIVTRIEAKAARADIAGALAELAKLPAPLRAPAEEWIRIAQGWGGAGDLSRRFASDALAALGKPQQ